eukprot:3762304-Prymnesium_polylepis.1
MVCKHIILFNSHGHRAQESHSTARGWVRCVFGRCELLGLTWCEPTPPRNRDADLLVQRPPQPRRPRRAQPSSRSSRVRVRRCAHARHLQEPISCRSAGWFGDIFDTSLVIEGGEKVSTAAGAEVLVWAVLHSPSAPQRRWLSRSHPSAVAWRSRRRAAQSFDVSKQLSGKLIVGPPEGRSITHDGIEIILKSVAGAKPVEKPGASALAAQPRIVVRAAPPSRRRDPASAIHAQTWL